MLSESSFVEKADNETCFCASCNTESVLPSPKCTPVIFAVMSSTPRSPSHARKIPENEYRRNTGRDPDTEPPSKLHNFHIKNWSVINKIQKDI